jgi:chaperonin GroEL (HSP60 family)
MSCYGVLCVKEALLRPFTCIISNAGFNPLEKLGDVIAGQKQAQSETITIDCDSGELINAISAGIVDPALVKMNAVKAGGEVAMAILRINTIIKMQESSPEDHDFRE